MDSDENGWIERARGGDAGAFELLVGRYQGRLVAFLWNLLGSGDDARDAAQDAFVQAFSGLGRFDGSRSFRSWIFAIAYHRGIDLLRRKRRFRRFWLREAAVGDAAAAGAAPTLDDSPFWRPVLKRVTPQERAVLSLKYGEDYGTGEIAAALGCTESTVRVHLLNARRKLKCELHAAGYAVQPLKPQGEEAP
jgi:RNA polymerase sigma-70 factor (ECF subfamily)